MENKVSYEKLYELLDSVERLKENIENYGLRKTKRELHFVKFELNNITKRIAELENGNE